MRKFEAGQAGQTPKAALHEWVCQFGSAQLAGGVSRTRAQGHDGEGVRVEPARLSVKLYGSLTEAISRNFARSMQQHKSEFF